MSLELIGVARGMSSTATRCQSQGFFSVPLRRRFTLSERAQAQGAIVRAMGKMIGNAMSIGAVRALLRHVLQCTVLYIGAVGN